MICKVATEREREKKDRAREVFVTLFWRRRTYIPSAHISLAEISHTPPPHCKRDWEM